jgi:adenosylcobinamide kinase/adenosylcobinamide-phosphate guanylyltransferase
MLTGKTSVEETSKVKQLVFVTGGCRSGKSQYALQTAEKIAATRKIYIATCVPQDDEMQQRVARHQKERNPNWVTVEEPLHLPQVIVENSPGAHVILIDCLTLWASNLMLETHDEALLKNKMEQLVQALVQADCPVVVVSNEVGSGIVPENRLARQFRDLVGWLNQAVAACADKVIWMVAGIPVTVKGDP